MVAIAPFRALRYAPGMDLSQVTSPPHDCAPPTGWQPYLDVPENIVHVVLAKREGGPDAAGAKANLGAWQTDGVLVRDASPALYLYEVRHGGGTMRGLLCRVAVDPDYKEIRRHEHTLKGKKANRFELRSAINCDPEPIWMLYRDERAWIEEILWSNAHEEVLQFEDEDGVEHRLWRVDRGEAIDEVVAQFEDRTVVIADGHHRYQTAIDHWAHTGKETDASILVCMVRDQDDGLGLVATHRLVSNTGKAGLAAHIVGLASEPLGEPAESWPAMVDENHVVIVGLDDGVRKAARVTLPPPANASCLASLAVTRAHDHILRDTWGIDLEQPEHYLQFTRDDAEALASATEDTVVILMPSERVEDVLTLAQEGDLMPQKSTYFVPKLRSGLVLSPLDEPRPKPWEERAGGAGKADFRLPPM